MVQTGRHTSYTYAHARTSPDRQIRQRLSAGGGVAGYCVIVCVMGRGHLGEAPINCTDVDF